MRLGTGQEPGRGTRGSLLASLHALYNSVFTDEEEAPWPLPNRNYI